MTFDRDQYIKGVEEDSTERLKEIYERLSEDQIRLRTGSDRWMDTVGRMGIVEAELRYRDVDPEPIARRVQKRVKE